MRSDETTTTGLHVVKERKQAPVCAEEYVRDAGTRVLQWASVSPCLLCHGVLAPAKVLTTAEGTATFEDEYSLAATCIAAFILPLAAVARSSRRALGMACDQPVLDQPKATTVTTRFASSATD